MVTSVDRALEIEKRQRDDTSKYCGELLAKQRSVNERVVAFAEDKLKPGSLVIDACAGPEGSLLASSMRGYRWVGNDVSARFAHHLRDSGARQILISDFSNAAFKDSIADGVFFVYALENIARPGKALTQASRVAKPGGVVLSAEPGPTRKVGKIILYSILKDAPENFPRILAKKPFKTDIPRFFEDKPYTAEEYANEYVINSLGVTMDEIRLDAYTLVDDRKKPSVSEDLFFNQFLRRYFTNVQKSAVNSGLDLCKAGLLVPAVDSEGEWRVNAPVNFKPDSWLEELMQARKGRGVMGQMPSWVARASHRDFVPVLVFQKQ